MLELIGLMPAEEQAWKWLDLFAKISLSIIGPAILWGAVMIFGIKEQIAVLQVQMESVIALESVVGQHVAAPAHDVAASWRVETTRRLEALEGHHR